MRKEGVCNSKVHGLRDAKRGFKKVKYMVLGAQRGGLKSKVHGPRGVKREVTTAKYIGPGAQRGGHIH